MKYHTQKRLFSESIPQCFHMRTIMSKGVGVSFSRCPVVTSALLNKRKKEREKKTFSGGEWKPQWEARHSLFFLPPLCCLLLWQWKHHWMTSQQRMLHIGAGWWQEQRKLQHRDGILSHHSTFINTVVLKDFYICVPWHLHYTPSVSNNMAIPGYKDFSYRDK